MYAYKLRLCGYRHITHTCCSFFVHFNFRNNFLNKISDYDIKHQRKKLNNKRTILLFIKILHSHKLLLPLKFVGTIVIYTRFL